VKTHSEEVVVGVVVTVVLLFHLFVAILFPKLKTGS
jgi:hypothetical protein